MRNVSFTSTTCICTCMCFLVSLFCTYIILQLILETKRKKNPAFWKLTFLILIYQYARRLTVTRENLKHVFNINLQRCKKGEKKGQMLSICQKLKLSDIEITSDPIYGYNSRLFHFHNCFCFWYLKDELFQTEFTDLIYV